MKRKMSQYVVGVLILGLALLTISCGGAAPIPTEEPKVEVPAADPSAIPHMLEGRDDCLMCHEEGTVKPFPADRAGYNNNTCTAYHQPAE